MSQRIFLSHPVHFVCGDDAVWPELASWNGTTTLEPEVLAKRGVRSLNNWIVRTYYELRLRHADVTISSQIRPSAINVVDAYGLARKKRLNFQFILVPRGDAHASTLANFIVPQNDVTDHFDRKSPLSIPMWPQPGIIPRSGSRGTAIEILAFKGDPRNLDERFQSKSFLNRLKALGVVLETSPYELNLRGPVHADYSNCDIILAARNLTEYDAGNKPASKLVNAWFGEVPALLGPEPAYLALKRSELDFFVVRSPDDVLRAVRRLKKEPGLYTSMVENGRQRRAEFTDDMIAQRWAEVLNGPAAAAFDGWQRSSWLTKATFVLGGLWGEAAAKRLHRNRFLNGERILDITAENAD